MDEKLRHWENENYSGKFLISDYNVTFEYTNKHTFGTQQPSAIPMEMFLAIAEEIDRQIKNKTNS